jgi:MFS family permease
LYSAATISGAFSGLIAYGVQKDLTEKVTGLEPWRLLFIIEGSAAMFVGILTMIVLPRFADKMGKRKNWLLSATDVDLANERARGYNTIGAKVDVRQIWTALQDPKSWLFACINAGVALGIASVGSFLPTFVREFGYSASMTHLGKCRPQPMMLVG